MQQLERVTSQSPEQQNILLDYDDYDEDTAKSNYFLRKLLIKEI